MFAASMLAAETEGSLKVLPNVDELLWASIAFLLVLFALLKFAFPRMQKGLQERTRRIQGQIEEAERAKREADTVLAEYRAKLNDARTEVQRIIDEGKKTAESLRADIVAKAETEAREIVARAQADVAGERDRAVQSLRDTLGELSVQLAARVIDRELRSTDEHRALVDRAIADLATSGNGRT